MAEDSTYNPITRASKVLKVRIELESVTPLQIRSGDAEAFLDSRIERTLEGDFFVNGYVWASLMRRALGRIETEQGVDLFSELGNYTRREDMRVSPFWFESFNVKIPETDVQPGNKIDRTYGTASVGALYQDEIIPPGLMLTCCFNYFVAPYNNIEEVMTLLRAALWVIDQGIETIGGGWSYGFGRLSVVSIRFKKLVLTNKSDRRLLWNFGDGLEWSARYEKHVEPKLWDKITGKIKSPWTRLMVTAGLLDGQLLAVSSSVEPLDLSAFFEPDADAADSENKLPDKFVYRRIKNVNSIPPEQEIIIPGKTIRQALFSVPLERMWRAKQSEDLCETPEANCTCSKCIQYRNAHPKEKKAPDCNCLRCKWFGSMEKRGLISVADATIKDACCQVLHRIQLCEHSMQNIQLFSGEYLTRGRFDIQVIIEGSHEDESVKPFLDSLCNLLKEMKVDKALKPLEKSTAPPGWYRIGSTSTCTGQIGIMDLDITSVQNIGEAVPVANDFKSE